MVGPDLIELLLSRRVVLCFGVEDFDGARVCGILDENGDGDARARAGVEDLSSLAAAALAGRALIPLQVVDEDLRELCL